MSCSGEVLTADDEDRLGRPCAIKTLPYETAAEQFKADQEVQALEETQDLPGIASRVAVFETGSKGNRQLILATE